MGYMRHHAIVVTGPESVYLSKATIQEVRDACFDIAGEVVSDLVKSPMNGYLSFFVAPDGSKEGWAESDDGDDKRKAVIELLESLRYEDGSTSYKYAEVQYGDDEKETKVTAASDFR